MPEWIPSEDDVFYIGKQIQNPELVVAFDIGNVLRKVVMPGQPNRPYRAVQRLYRVLHDVDGVEVDIVTMQPTQASETRDAAWVMDLITGHIGLPLPDMLVICYDDSEKFGAFERLDADIVFDDKNGNIERALEAGAFAFQAM